MKILIVKLSALGDVVQTLPSLTLLKRAIPDSQIDWVVDKRNAEILENHPYIHQLIIFSKQDFFSFSKFKNFLKILRKTYYDIVIDYQGLLKSGIITGLTRAKYKIGFSNSREGSPLFYNIKLPPYDINLHAVKRYLTLTKKVIELFKKDQPMDTLEEKVEALFSSEILKNNLPFIKKPYIILIPSARWKTKLWPYLYWERFIELCQDIAQKFDLFITGSLLDKDLIVWAKEIENRYTYIHSLVGKLSLKELAILVKNSSAVVTVDTGPMHIASAFKKPIVALFGPTSPERTGPWGGNFKILKSSLSCSPCFKKKCNHWRCMNEIKPEEVKKVLQEILY